MHLDEVCRQTEAHRWGGRVAIGHVTKLSAIEHRRLAEIGRRLADAGVAVTVLPATDLFLMGRASRAPRAARRRARASTARSWRDLLARDQQRTQPVHAVRRLLAHPHGEPLRQHRPDRPARDLQACLDMVTTLPARLINAADYGIAVGHPADLVVLDSRDRRDGGGRARATPARHQARPSQLYARCRNDPPSGLSSPPLAAHHALLRNPPGARRQLLADISPGSADRPRPAGSRSSHR